MSSSSTEPEVREDVPLSTLTTLRVGGPARRVVRADSRGALIDAALSTWADGDDWLVLGGGSNLLVGDDGFDGTILVPGARGIEEQRDGDRVLLRVEAGKPWDDLVAETVERGFSGIEALSGIPGSTGAAPIQNIGAYGQELSSSLVAVEFLDYLTGEESRMTADELGLGYRTSVFKRGLSGVVVAVELELVAASGHGPALSAPIRYAQLAGALGVRLGDQVPVPELREAVLALRRGKGMVLDPGDPDSVSAGSFFTNPIVSERFARSLPPEAPRWPVTPDEPDVAVPLGAELPPAPRHEHEVKLSAAWLIEHAGVRRGFSLPGSRAGISTKHTLALVNRGGATAEEILELARYVRAMVQTEFGVLLQPEPVLLGATL